VNHDSSRHNADKETLGEAHAQLLEEVQSRQRNTLWPDTMRNGQSVDALLWRGSPEATAVQRVGIVVFGLLFLSIGLFFVFSLAPELHSVLSAVFGVFFVALGARVTLNAFRHNLNRTDQTSEGKRRS
jgi:hypothetical protein